MAGSRAFGEWLRAALRREGWTQAEFARRIGTSGSTVWRWIEGVARPDTASCDKIADVLTVPQRTVLVRAGHMAPDDDADPPTRPVAERYRRVLDALARIDATPTVIDAVVRYIEVIGEAQRSPAGPSPRDQGAGDGAVTTARPPAGPARNGTRP